MADPAQTPPAGTPPAQTPAQGGPFKTFSTKEEHDEYLNGIVKDRLDREKKKYADYDDLKKAADELKGIKAGQMSELEKLKADLADRDKTLGEKDAELTKLQLERIKAAKLAEAKMAPEWIDSVSGSTEEEIAASVATLAKRLNIPPPNAAQGAGNHGVPPSQNSKTKIWTQAEIRELRLNGKLTDEVMADIRQATAEGRVQ